MNAIGNIGAIIEVSPCDDVWAETNAQECDNLTDRTPFRFRVEGRLEDGQIFYGLFGPVVSGPDRYRNLVCNIMVRVDGTDWRNEVQSQANFKVGPKMAYRDHRYDFRHPEGTRVDGYPIFGRFGWIELVDGNYPRGHGKLTQHVWRSEMALESE